MVGGEGGVDGASKLGISVLDLGSNDDSDVLSLLCSIWSDCIIYVNEYIGLTTTQL